MEQVAIDREIEGMREAYLALVRLTPPGRARALAWLMDRFAADERRDLEAALVFTRFARGVNRTVRRAARDSGSDRNGENGRSPVECEASQSGAESASPKTSPDQEGL